MGVGVELFLIIFFAILFIILIAWSTSLFSNSPFLFMSKVLKTFLIIESPIDPSPRFLTITTKSIY